MTYKTLVLTGLILLTTSTAHGAQLFYNCTHWVVNGGGSGSCSGNTVTFTATDNYVTNGTYNGSGQDFTITPGNTYYVTWRSPTGTYNQAHILQEYGGAQEVIQTYTFGTGTSTATFVGHTGTNVKLMLDNNGGGGGGTVTDVCISDTGLWECGYGDYPFTPTATSTATSTATQNDVVFGLGIIIFILGTFFGTFVWSLNREKKHV